MPLKVNPKRTQILKIPCRLPLHWKLEQWAKDMDLGKIEAAEKILEDFLKRVKLEIEQ